MHTYRAGGLRLLAILVTTLGISSGAHAAQAFVTVPGAAFVGDSPRTTLTYLVNGAAFSGNTGTSFAFAPVSLPHGLSITHFGCTLKDDEPNGYIRASLYRTPLDPTMAGLTSHELITSVSTAGLPASQDFGRPFGTAAPGTETVRNASYAYFVVAVFSNVQDLLDGHSLLGCSVRLE